MVVIRRHDRPMLQITLAIVVSVGPLTFCLWLCYRVMVRAAKERRAVAVGAPAPLISPAPSAARCWARLLFVRRDDWSLVLDGVVDESREADVPAGTPFSLRCDMPVSAGGWVADHLRVFAEENRLMLLELRKEPSGAKARVLVGDLALVLKLERASGWPALTFQ